MSIKHFNNDIQGWFNFGDIYKQALNQSQDGDIFVEVGSWLGKSAAWLAVEIANSNKKIDFYCVDIWSACSEYTRFTELMEKDNLYNAFLKNTEPVKHIIKPIRKDSVEASALFKDNSLSLVFIDASHIYENVLADLHAYYPKVKKENGIFAGHDYAANAKGVIRAVDEFKEKFNLNLTVIGNKWLLNSSNKV